MKKDDLLKIIATYGYNSGFGAKKNFASHDIVVKLPSWIGFTTLAIGIIQLGYSTFSENKQLSTVLILISVISLYVSVHNSDTEKFDKEGIRLTKNFNKLKDLYYTVKSSSKDDFAQEKLELDEIIKDFYSNTITKQVFLSQWFAHFKFFYEMQIDWINEQLNFKFFKDKIPNSLKVLFVMILVTSIIFICYEYFGNFSTIFNQSNNPE
tara:strand:+ start:77 stop:703 length:627 start_codon:yes stop_codon:yes gene_type:complete